MTSPDLREWVKTRYSPGRGVTVTVTVQDGNASAAWSVKRFPSEALSPAVREARTRAIKALNEIKDALRDAQSETEGSN